MKHVSLNLKVALWLAVLLIILHLTALFFYLAWIYWWYDLALHLLGGLVGGFATYWCIFESGVWSGGRSLSAFARVLVVLICVIVAAVLWEAFEYIYQIAEDPRQSHVIDTTYDLILGSLGAVIAGLRASYHHSTLHG